MRSARTTRPFVAMLRLQRRRRLQSDSGEGSATSVGVDAMTSLNDALGHLADDSMRRSELWFPHVHSNPDRLLSHLGMGLAGEAGEACDELKKVLRDANYDFTETGQEMTDALIYLVMLGKVIGLDWELSVDHMIVKCESRWGQC